MMSAVAGVLDPSSCLFPSVSDHQVPPLVQSLPVCLRCSPDSAVPACIAPLHPVCNPGYRNGSDTLATFGSSAVGFCPSFCCPCGVLCACQRELVLMISAVACGLDPSSYLLPFGWNDTMCRVAGPLLPGVSAIAGIVPLRPVSIAGFSVGSDTLASLGASAVWFCLGSRCHCGVLCDCQRGLVLLLLAVACWFPHLPSWPFG